MFTIDPSSSVTLTVPQFQQCVNLKLIRDLRKEEMAFQYSKLQINIQRAEHLV